MKKTYLGMIIALTCALFAGNASSARTQQAGVTPQRVTGSDIPQRQSAKLWIVCGGQTGVDRAALDSALNLYLPVRGWCPKGRLAEDGKIAERYPLQETPSERVELRTEWNARDSDGTLVLAFGPLSGGTKFTVEMAALYRKPALVVDLEAQEPKESLFRDWIRKHRIRVLNVAGPRESSAPGKVYNKARALLDKWFKPWAEK